MSKPKLLWHSNSPWAPTGYGQQTGLFASPLAEHYDIALSSFYGLEGAPRGWQGIPVLPGLGGGDYGSQSLVDHARRFFGGDLRGGLAVTLMDVWVLNASAMSDLNLACWVPVDHEPAPQAVVDFFVQSGAIPIAMSRFGQRMLGRLDPLYVPHAVDTEVYKPTDTETAREGAFPEGAFLIGMVAANKGRPSRKCFAQALQAFARFAKSHDDAFLYLHTMLDANLAQGENILGIIRDLEIPVDRIRFADQYAMTYMPHSCEAMAQLYSAFDVLLSPSMGEGFGVPVLEAQACGTPAIVTDFSAMSEVCGAGWHVDYSRHWTGLNAWQAMPDVDDIVEAMEDCYSKPEADRQQLSQVARQHALQYSLPRVLKEHMLPALRAVEERFANQQPVRIKPRRLKAAA